MIKLQRGIGGFQLCPLQYITHAVTTLLMKLITLLFPRLDVLTDFGLIVICNIELR